MVCRNCLDCKERNACRKEVEVRKLYDNLSVYLGDKHVYGAGGRWSMHPVGLQ
jgi:hypothetical protein